jgi:hypothetical protein
VSWFWHALWICLIVIPAALLWVGAVFHIVLFRADLKWWHRLIWLAVVLLIPVVGALAYAFVAVDGAADGVTAYGRLDTSRAQRALTDAEYQRQLQHDHRFL